MMKKEYMNPSVEITVFKNEDIITTSSFDPDNILNNNNKNDWNW